MLFAIGPALGALSTVSSLLESAAAGLGQAAGNELTTLSQSFNGGGTNGQPQSQPVGSGSSTPFNSGTMAALISLQGQSATGTSGGSGLFAKLDANGDGSISKSEFENTLSGAGVDSSSADALFNKLDANGDGSISKGEVASARGGSIRRHSHHAGGGSGGGGAASLLNATNADGSTTQTATNADGSTTTTITYADGSTVSSTTPAASQNGGTPGGGTGNAGNGNLIQKLIQMQSMLLSQPAATTAAMA